MLRVAAYDEITSCFIGAFQNPVVGGISRYDSHRSDGNHPMRDAIDLCLYFTQSIRVIVKFLPQDPQNFPLDRFGNIQPERTRTRE